MPIPVVGQIRTNVSGYCDRRVTRCLLRAHDATGGVNRGGSVVGMYRNLIQIAVARLLREPAERNPVASVKSGTVLRRKETLMRIFTIALLASAGTLFASGAFAAPMTNGYSGAKAESAIEQVRLSCRHGRCNQSRGSRRVVVQQRYGETRQYEQTYAPRERYIEQRRYYNDEPRSGVGISAPGVSVGIGTNRY